MKGINRYYNEFSNTGLYLHSNIENFNTGVRGINMMSEVKSVLQLVIKSQKEREKYVVDNLGGIENFRKLFDSTTNSFENKMIQTLIKTKDKFQVDVDKIKVDIDRLISKSDATGKSRSNVEAFIATTNDSYSEILKTFGKVDKTLNLLLQEGLSKESVKKNKKDILEIFRLLENKAKGITPSVSGRKAGLKNLKDIFNEEQMQMLRLLIAGPWQLQYFANYLSETHYLPQLVEGGKKVLEGLGYKKGTAATKISSRKVGTVPGLSGGTSKSDIKVFFDLGKSLELSVSFSGKAYKSIDTEGKIMIHETKDVRNIIASMGPTIPELASKQKGMEKKRLTRSQFTKGFLSEEGVNKLVYLLINNAYLERAGGIEKRAVKGQAPVFKTVPKNPQAINEINLALNAGAALWFGQVIEEKIDEAGNKTMKSRVGHVDYMIINGQFIPMSLIYEDLLEQLSNKNLISLSQISSSGGGDARDLYKAKLEYIKLLEPGSDITYRGLSGILYVHKMALDVYRNFSGASIKYQVDMNRLR